MSERLIYVPLEGTINVYDDDGSTVKLTCVGSMKEEGGGCYGCWFKREAGKPQEPFCNAVACGDFERMDGKDVIFQKIKRNNN